MKNVAEAVRRKHWVARHGPGLLGVLAFFTWVSGFGKGTDLLEKTRFDVLGVLHSWGTIGLVMALILGWGIGFVLAGVVGVTSCKYILQRRIAAMPRDEHGRICVCDECLYPMHHAAASEVSRCPECGSEYFKTGSETD